MSNWGSFEDIKLIDIKYFRDIEPIQVLEKGDWIDLRAGEDVDLKKGDEALIPLGIGMIYIARGL